MEIENVFKKFTADREKLQGIYSRASSLLSALDLKTEAETLKGNQDSLSSDTFKVLVVGEFKRGKSTFINALLGEEVLPAFSIPCTAVINEIKYSEEKKAILHFVQLSLVMGGLYDSKFQNTLPPRMVDSRIVRISFRPAN